MGVKVCIFILYVCIAAPRHKKDRKYISNNNGSMKATGVCVCACI